MGTADHTPQPGPADDALRIGDAERAAAAAALARHWTAGRLDAEEFEQRTAAAWNARTGSALSELFRDLPADLAVAVASRSWRSPVAREALARLATRATATSRRRLAAGATVAALAVVGAGGALAAGGEHDERPCRTVQAAQQDPGDGECLAAEGR